MLRSLEKVRTALRNKQLQLFVSATPVHSNSLNQFRSLAHGNLCIQISFVLSSQFLVYQELGTLSKRLQEMKCLSLVYTAPTGEYVPQLECGSNENGIAVVWFYFLKTENPVNHSHCFKITNKYFFRMFIYTGNRS